MKKILLILFLIPMLCRADQFLQYKPLMLPDLNFVTQPILKDQIIHYTGSGTIPYYQFNAPKIMLSLSQNGNLQFVNGEKLITVDTNTGSVHWSKNLTPDKAAREFWDDVVIIKKYLNSKNKIQ